ncbi:flagellar brake protein [Nitratiruptor sp. YY09-18]|uniref:flagellar brake protein n=1 Tax=Nitratiruptor sp. YY09-18 TaxID=2724901 RepID=UPI0019160588|nr:PilZ domain-containing protein [Nitratiruptor sp. YY09-18]BCD68371.1 hypothetical protein NitYY0918_C1286 [Nitratiruptor sp. YY09-18]
MQENLSRFDTLKLATQYWHGDETTTKLIVVLFILALIIFFIAGFYMQKRMRERNLKRYFVTFAKEKELTDEEIKILWDYSHKMERDPILVLEFKAPFEKVIDIYIKENPNADENIIKDMRRKLDFEVLSPHVPLVTTKDIEIFQNGRMIFANNKSINVALYDKDEKFMYWVAIDNDVPADVHPGEYVKIVFIRNEDGIYTIEVPIAEILRDNGKTLIKLPHTFDLHRVQRRESPRVKVNKPAKMIIEETPIDVTIIDISTGGAKICTNDKNDVLKKIKYGEEAILEFKLDNRFYSLKAKVLEIDRRPKSTCLRFLFDGVPEDIKDELLEFVQKEQLKLAHIKRKQ